MLSEFFFFKQKTAYEMRISDWSSDVCSSDLFVVPEHAAVGSDGQVRHVGLDRLHSIQTQMLIRNIIDCPWFCVIWQHRWNNPALPGHSQPRQRLKAGWRQLESLCDRHRHRVALMRFPTARGMDSHCWGGST